MPTRPDLGEQGTAMARALEAGGEHGLDLGQVAAQLLVAPPGSPKLAM
jgi:hypothetical protein